jgi:hypothetical protein
LNLSGALHHVLGGQILLGGLAGGGESLFGSGVSLRLNVNDDVFNFIFMLFQEWADEALVNDSCSISLRGHQKNEEHNSEDIVIWDESEDELEEHLDQLENSEDAPEAQPSVDVVFIL